MPLANPKSLVASALLFAMFTKSLLQGTHLRWNELHYFNLICLPVAAVLCFCHALNGKRPLLGQSEIHTSLVLGGLCALIAIALSYAWLRAPRRKPDAMIAVAFLVTAVFYFWQAFKEKRSCAAQDRI
jgi:hypothetical protein